MTAAAEERPDPRTVVPVPANPGSPGWGVPDPVQQALEKAREEQRARAKEEATTAPQPTPEPTPESP